MLGWGHILVWSFGQIYLCGVAHIHNKNNRNNICCWRTKNNQYWTMLFFFFFFFFGWDPPPLYLGPLYTRSQGRFEAKFLLPIGWIYEISPKAFTQGVKTESRKFILLLNRQDLTRLQNPRIGSAENGRPICCLRTIVKFQ